MEDFFKQISQEKITQYQAHLEKLELSEATIKRRLSALRKFYGWAEKEGYLEKLPLVEAPIAKEAPLPKKLSFKYLTTRLRPSLPTVPTIPYLSDAYEVYQSISITKYLHYAILIIFCVALGMGLYNQLTGPKAELAEAYPTALTPPNRYLSFQGRLTDSSNNPITSITNFVFKLYDAAGTGSPPTGGNQLWTSGDCSIDPDVDGIFSVLLGSDCGSEIDATVFSENAGVWLQITVGTGGGAQTLSPRIQVATVGYALNAETLQGYPPGTAASNIPYIDSTGKVVIAAASPTLQATSASAAFVIEGKTGLVLQTASASNANITIAPDGTGALNINLGGASGNQMRVTDANVTSGSLVSVYAGTNATGFDLLNLSSGSTETTRFSVDESGNTYAAGNVGIGTTNPGAKLDVVGDVKIGTVNSVDDNNQVLTTDSGIVKYIDTSNWDKNSGDDYGAWWLAGDSGTPQSIGAGNTASFIGGIGIGTTASATDTLTISVDESYGFAWTGAQSWSSTATFNGTLDANGVVTLGDNGDNVTIDSSVWDISGAGAGSGFTQFTVDNIDLNGNTISATDNGGLYLYDNASNGIFIEDGGYVGIGTTNPGAPLHVIGDLYVSNGISLYENAVSDGTVEATKFCTGDGEGNCTTDFGSLGGGFWTDQGGYIDPDTITSGSFRIYDNSGLAIGYTTDPGQNNLIISGNVGIGTTAPDSKLHLVGGDVYVAPDSGYSFDNPSGDEDLYVYGNLEVDGTIYGAGGSLVSGSGTTNYVPKWTSSSALGDSVMYDDGTKIGIGTTNPSFELDVNGDARIQGGELYLTGISSSSSTTEGTIYYDSDSYQLMVYANGKWQADRTTATKIVAANDSQNKEKADYVCDGTDDEVQINNAINALSSGGVVALLEGTYTVNPQTLISGSTYYAIGLDSNVSLIGSGAGTVIKLKDTWGSNTGYIIYADTKSRALLQNFKIDGNKANQSAGTQNGIYFNDTDYSRIDKLWVESMRTYAINLSLSSKYNTISGSHISSNTSHGIYISVSDADNNVISGNSFTYNDRSVYITSSNNTISNNTFYSANYQIYVTGSFNSISGNTLLPGGSSSYSGIYISGANNVISGNTLEGGYGNYGLSLSSASRNTISGNSIYQFQNNILLSSSSDNLIDGNDVYYSSGGAEDWSSGIRMVSSSNNNTISNNTISKSSRHGIHLSGSSYNAISGNMFHNNGQGTNDTYSEIYLADTSTYNTITSNILKADAANKAKYGIRENSSSDDYNVIEGNIVNGPVTADISIQGANTTLAGNKTTTSGEGLFDIRTSSGTTNTALVITQSGSGYAATFTGGNVGIGTTNPSQELDVVGDIQLSENIYMTDDNWIGIGASDERIIFDAAGDIELMGANVGIGTTNPGAPLHVIGDLYVSDGISLYENAVSDGTVEAIKFCTGDGESNCTTDFGSLGGVGGSGTNNYIPKWTGSTTLGDSVIYETGSNIGIGTTAVNSKLEVAGDIALGTNYIKWGTSGSEDTNLYRSTTDTLKTDDNFFAASKVALGSGASIPTNQTVYVKETYTDTSGELATIYSEMAANPGSASTANFYGAQLQASGFGSQNIGALWGTNAKAVHYGTGTVPQAAGNYASIENTAGGTINNAYAFYTSRANTGAGTIDNIYGFYVPDASNTGGGTLSNNYGIYIANQTGASSSDIGLYIADADTYSLQLASTDGDAASGITFGTDTNLYRMAANKLRTNDSLIVDGNVGIGTTTPGYKLDVAGDARIQTLASGSTNTVVTHSSGVLQTRTVDSRVWGSSLVDYSGTSANYIPKMSDADTITNSVIYETGGNIGIGTTNPGAPLHVIGDLYVSDGISLYENAVSDGTVEAIKFCTGDGESNCTTDFGSLGGVGGSGTNNYIPKWTGSTTLGDSVIYETGSKIGIGTTNPGFELDVNGDARIQGGELYLTGVTSSSSTTEGTIYYDSDAYQLMVYANGKWQADRTTATVIVGTSNSPSSRNYEKADFVADGTDDDTTIENAIAALPSGGGIVVLLEGTYVIDSNGIDITDDNVSLIGVGRATVLQRGWDTSTDKGVITVGDGSGSTPVTGVTIANLSIDGQKASISGPNNLGIFFHEDITQSRILNTWIYDNDGIGIKLNGGDGDENTYILVQGNEIRNNDDDGIDVTYTDNSIVSDNLFYSNGTFSSHNIFLSVSDNNTVSGNNIQLGSASGIYLNGSDNNTVSGNYIESSGVYGAGIALSSSDNNIVQGNNIQSSSTHGISLTSSINNTVSNNVIYEVGSGANDGININASDNNIISSNRILDSSDSQYGINVSNSTSENNYLIGNEISGGGFTAEINDAGTGTTIQHRDQFQIDANGDIALTITQSGSADIVNIFDGSTEVFTILDGGNVGIGTTNPSQELDVVGDIQLSENIYMTDDNWIGIGASDERIIFDTAGDIEIMGANVGIGTTSPSGKLQVVGDEVRIGDAGTVNYATGDGDLYVEDTLEVDGTIYGGGITLPSFTQGSVIFAGSGGALTEDNANFFWDDTNNRLGIGTTAPDATLEVFAASGAQLRLENTEDTDYADFTVDGSGDLTVAPSGNLVLNTTGGTIDIDDATIDLTSQSTDIKVHTNSTSALKIYDTSGNNSYLEIDSTNNVTAIGSVTNTNPQPKVAIYFSPRITSATGVYLSGGASSSSTYSNFTGDAVKILMNRTYTGTGALDDSGNYLDVVRSHTMNNASGSYTISGDLVTFSSNCTQTDGICTDTSSILSLTQNYANATGTVLNITGKGTGDLLNVFDDTTEVFTILNGGNVGIGTTNPSQELDVVGDIQLSENIYMTDDNWIGIGASDERIIFDTAGDIEIMGANVGIGTTSPARTLHLRTGTDQNLRFGTLNNEFLIDTANDAGSVNVPLRMNFSELNLMGGNVGIGTTNPSTQLHLTGDITVGGNDILDAGGSTAITFDGFQNTALTGNLTMQDGKWIGIDSAAERIIFDGTGDDIEIMGANVGIGTTGPSSALEVVGQVTLPTTGSSGGLVIGGDASLYRGAANRLQLGTDDTLRVTNTAGEYLDIVAGGSEVYIDAEESGATDWVLVSAVSGDTQPRFNIKADGTHWWGPGNAVVDTTLYRVDANKLGTDDTFYVGGNVGIGTTNPSTQLHLTGDITVGGNDILDAGGSTAITFDGSQNTALAGNLTVSGTGTHSFAGTIDPTNVTSFTLTGTETLGATYYINNSGDAYFRYVGIGVAPSATYPLYVNANAYLTDTTYLGTTLTYFDTSGNLQMGGGVISDSVDDVDIADNLDVSGDLTVSGDIECMACIDTGELYTATNSSSGNTAANTTMNDYTFYPNAEQDDCNNLPGVRYFSGNATNDTVGRLNSNSGCTTGSWDVRWRYVTASDHPTIWLIANIDSSISAVWQGEDPVHQFEYPKNPNPLEGTILLAGQRFVNVEPLTISQLDNIYKSLPEEDKKQILTSLKNYIVTERHWLDNFSEISDISKISERYQPAARLHAMRFFAIHYQIDPAELILETMVVEGDQLVPKKNYYETLLNHLQKRQARLAANREKEEERARLPLAQQDGDIAEWYTRQEGETPNPGDIISLGPQGFLVKSFRSYDSKILGIIATSPLETLGRKVAEDDVRVSLIGRAPVKISTINGSLNVGDPITSSDIPGVGMKATKAGPIVGKALEPYDNPDPNAVGKILVFINLGWYDPDVYLTSTGDLNITLIDADSNADERGYKLTNAAGEVIERVGAFAEAAIAELRTGLIEAQEIITERLVSKEIETEKLISPLVESQEIKTERISLKEIEAEPGEDVIVNLVDQVNQDSKFGRLIVKGKEGKKVVSIDAEGNATFSGIVEAEEFHAKKIVAEEIVGLKGKFGELIAATVSAEKIQGLEERLAQLETSPSPTPSPTPTPTPTPSPEPEPPATESGEIDVLDDVELSPDIEALVNEILGTSLEATPQAQLSNVYGDNLDITNNLTVLGATSLADTSIAGSLNVDGTMTLANNSINSLTGPLYLQNLGLGGIDILAGKVTIDEQGNAVFEGNVTIKGRLALSEIEPLPDQDLVISLMRSDLSGGLTSPEESRFGKLLVKGVDDEIVASIEASGTATFKKLAIAKAEEAVREISTTEIETNATAGEATILAGETEITIKSQFVKESTLIYVTPMSNTQNKVLFVKAKKAATEQELGWFKVSLDTPITQDIEFSWWIIN